MLVYNKNIYRHTNTHIENAFGGNFHARRETDSGATARSWVRICLGEADYSVTPNNKWTSKQTKLRENKRKRTHIPRGLDIINMRLWRLKRPESE